ncbi:hypothetical protein H2248_003692 [Termitomyces sp. 'cryptogamus']|nr:hypothetical protein H2248_003692 [Termitomyces sp. 'cryptogamus']
MMTPSLSLSLALGGIAFIIWKTLFSRKRLPLPPGPPSLPLIGHAHLMPSMGQDLFFYELSKTYGDVIHLRVLNKSFIILNSVQAAADLLDKHGAKYGGRPSLPIYDILGMTKLFFLLNEDDECHAQRKMFQQYFSKEKCKEYHTIQIREARLLAQNLLSSPADHNNALFRFAASIIIDITFGHQSTKATDPYIQIVSDFCDLLKQNGLPGATPIDFFPILRYFPSWFPGTYYATFAYNSVKTVQSLMQYPLAKAMEQMANGTARPSFVSYNLDKLSHDGPEKSHQLEQIKATSVLTYFAGAETVSSTLSFFILAMVLHPECQVQAQKEIDTVIGTDRLPEFEDREKLPYLECLLQEVVRWNHAAPTGLPHRNLEDDVYRDMFIPKNATIIANIRAMTLDESVYKDATKFDPTRFLPAPEGRNEAYRPVVFGFGRRLAGFE